MIFPQQKKCNLSYANFYQKLHEGRRTHFCFPAGRERIPKWFEHQSIRQTVISFWFRNKIPSIVLFFSIGGVANYNEIIELRVNLFINGHKYTFYVKKFIVGSLFVSGHTYLFHLDLEGLVHCSDNYEKLESKLEEALSKNEWIHTKLKLEVRPELHTVERFLSTKFGIHVVKVENNLKDIQFTNPYRKSNSMIYLNTSVSKFLQQRMCLLPSLIPLYLFVFSFMVCFGGYLIFFF